MAPSRSDSMRLILAVGGSLIVAAPLCAQAVPSVHLGWGVDTLAAAWTDAMWHPQSVDVLKSWGKYLLSDAHLQRPTAYWAADEQAKWPAYDLTAGIAYKGMPATVLDIRPVADSTFLVRTLFSSVSQDRIARPVAITRVYAVREGGRWVFSNALCRHTEHWPRHSVASFMFVVDPVLEFNSARAASTAAFADSLAARLGVAPPEGVTFVVARNPEALHEAMGVEWTFAAQGHGYSIPWNNLILSGDSTFREGNRHEVVHHIMAPLLEDVRPHPLVNEGVATWLGGSVGRTYTQLQQEYSAYLRQRTDITLAHILERRSPDEGWYPAGALLVDLVHRRQGWDGVTLLLRSGRTDDELRAALMKQFGLSWSEIESEWKRHALSASTL
jgi:hypothetical protein